VHEFVLLLSVFLVLVRCKSSEAFFVDVYSQRLKTSYKHVYPQIKFTSIYQQRIANIPRDDWMILQADLVNIFNQVNTSTSG